MRLIGNIQEQKGSNPFAFSRYLAGQGIENACEESDQKGTFRIWVYDEDQVALAEQYFQEYLESPTHHRYFAYASTPYEVEQENTTLEETPSAPSESPSRPRKRFLSSSPYGPVTLFLLFGMVALFILTQMQRPAAPMPQVSGVVDSPLLSPIEIALLYDYPLYFSLRDAFYRAYPPKEIEAGLTPSAHARALLKEMQKTPVWMGVYEQFLVHHRHPEYPLRYKGALFEKIRQGEVWRFITPAFLHLDLLHIFFNLLWLILLGNQMEFRIGSLRYILFILVAAFVANTAQYLMGGPFFMGLSGVVVAMAAFVWARQQRAPWEGYLLNRFTLVFLTIFVVGLVVLQIALFTLQLFGIYGFSIGIANTAHIAGGLVGYLFGRLRFFALQPKGST